MRLTSRLPLRHSPGEIRARLRRVMGLRQHDPVDHGVQSAVAAPAQSVPDSQSRRGLEWRDAGVRGELRVIREALAWSQETREDACGKGVHAAEARESWKSRRGDVLNLQADVVDVTLHKFEANRQPAYGRSPMLLKCTPVWCRVPRERPERAACDEATDLPFVFGIDLQEQMMDLTPDAVRLPDELVSLGGQYAEDGGLVIGLDARQRRSFHAHRPRYRGRIERVRLLTLPRTSPTACGPARVHLEHGLTEIHKSLRQASSISAGAFNAPLAGLPHLRRPPLKLIPSR